MNYFCQSSTGKREEEARARREGEGADREGEGRADREAEADRRADAESSERYGHDNGKRSRYVCLWGDFESEGCSLWRASVKRLQR